MASARKPPLPLNSSTANRRSLPPTAATSNRSTRSPTPSTPNSSTVTSTPMSARRNTLRDGVPSAHRNSISSPLSARSAVKRPPSDSVSSDAELEHAALFEELRSKLAKTESTAEADKEEFSKQLKAVQMRLDEALSEQAKLEEVAHVKDETIETLEMQVKELTRAKRDQENIYEAERIAAAQEKEEMLDREEELNVIIQRLKDQLAQRDKNSDFDAFTARSYSDADESLSFAPSNPSSAPVPNNNLLLQKDKLIESLRLELAEAQIRLAEADHLGGTKLHQLEQQLLETRMTNARLMEDNESFQLLLSSAALNGDFPRGDYLTNAFSEVDPEPESVIVKKVQGSPRNSISLASTLASNLAEELEEANHAESEKYKRLEHELKSLKDSNKAMSLYINNIIERILQHKDSEAILDKTISPKEQKAPLPAEKDEPQPTGFLSRTRSLAVGRKRASPPPSGGALQRSQSLRSPTNVHKRSQSETSPAYTGTTMVNSIYPNRTSSMFPAGQNEHYNARRGNRPRDSSSTSVDSGVSDEVRLSSPPALTIHTNVHTSTVGPIAGNKLRPLRLVQENAPNALMSPVSGGLRKISGDYKEDDEHDKKDRRQSKRSSWMGWFGRGKDEEVSSIAESVVFERKDVE
ncbi:hypothetical protein RUND412_009802 [Rhizina undulata]